MQEFTLIILPSLLTTFAHDMILLWDISKALTAEFVTNMCNRNQLPQKLLSPILADVDLYYESVDQPVKRKEVEATLSKKIKETNKKEMKFERKSRKVEKKYEFSPPKTNLTLSLLNMAKLKQTVAEDEGPSPWIGSSRKLRSRTLRELNRSHDSHSEHNSPLNSPRNASPAQSPRNNNTQQSPREKGSFSKALSLSLDKISPRKPSNSEKEKEKEKEKELINDVTPTI